MAYSRFRQLHPDFETLTVRRQPAFHDTDGAPVYEAPWQTLLSEVFRSCVQAPGDKFPGTISPRTSSPLFSAGRLHIHFEMEENLTLESAAKSLVYSIEIMTANQTTMLPVESLIVGMAELWSEMTYRLPADGTFCLTAHGTAVKIVCKR